MTPGTDRRTVSSMSDHPLEEAVMTALSYNAYVNADEIVVEVIDGRADADTEAAVLAALVADDEVHAQDIEVKARDGYVTLSGLHKISVDVRDNDVTLTGWVTSPEHRRAAVAAAENAPGVAYVHNDLRLRARPS